MANTLETIMGLFAENGAREYLGEPVSQLEHALQTARLAVEQGASDALVVAALLHDVGHLLDDRAADAAERGVDARHEDLGDRFLSQYFDKNVTEPIRLHVSAKRYLCAVDDVYLNQLSPASLHSLAMQGGPMNGEEAAAFVTLRYANDAISLRLWDDEAKQAGLDVPGLDAYIPYLQRRLMGAAARP
jgi:[1-hydroxy-2-(trimethylamino)ethyl]phosphonate dioxygenase